MNLDAIRERSARAAQTRGGEHVTWSLACIASAADVPLLIAEISNLRAALGEERAAHAYTRNELAEEQTVAAQLRAENEHWRQDYAGLRAVAEIWGPRDVPS